MFFDKADNSWKFLRFAFLAILSAVVSNSALAEPAIERLSQLVADSFQAQDRGESDARITPILEWQAQLDKDAVSGDEHLALKYMLSHWRMWTVEYLIQKTKGKDAAQFVQSLDQIARMGYALDAGNLRVLTESFDALPENSRRDTEVTRKFAQTVATQGDPSSVRPLLTRLGVPQANRLAGPESVLRIPPMEPHPWWRNGGGLHLEGMDQYEWIGDEGDVRRGIRYRGLELREGDVLLVDLNKLFDGLNTSFSQPRSSFTHNAIVVFLDVNGRKVPAAYEIHAAGLRVVPLNRYLSPDFTLHTEVMRVKEASRLGPNFSKDLNQLVRETLKDQMGYDFNAQPIPEGGYSEMVARNQRCVVCSSLADMVFKTLGIDVKIPSSLLHPGARENVGRLGLQGLAERGSYLTPTDLKLSKDLQSVGTIDNGFTRNILRESIMGAPAVPDSLGHWMSTRVLDPSSIRPLWRAGLYRLVRSVGANAGEGNWRGKAILALTQALVGLDRTTLPQAPGPVLATVVTLNNALESSAHDLGRGLSIGFPGSGGLASAAGASVDCGAYMEQLGSGKPFELRAFESSKGVRTPVRGVLKGSGVDSWFR